MQASKFRKKPVVVEARQFDGTPENGAALVTWLTENGAEAEYHPFLADHFKGDSRVFVAHPDPYMRVVTLEGTMVAGRGDWIIRGVQGEFYPCKPDIFAATYEAVDESPDSDSCICARPLPVDERPKPCAQHGWLGEGVPTPADSGASS